MPNGGKEHPTLAAENRRLLAQAEIFASDAWIKEEAARWREALPAERLAETFRLCSLLPWWRSLWSEDVRLRTNDPAKISDDARAILERMRNESRDAPR